MKVGYITLSSSSNPLNPHHPGKLPHIQVFYFTFNHYSPQRLTLLMHVSLPHTLEDFIYYFIPLASFHTFTTHPYTWHLHTSSIIQVFLTIIENLQKKQPFIHSKSHLLKFNRNIGAAYCNYSVASQLQNFTSLCGSADLQGVLHS